MNNGVGAVVERVEGIEAMIGKLQNDLNWPQQQIQFAVEEFRQVNIYKPKKKWTQFNFLETKI